MGLLEKAISVLGNAVNIHMTVTDFHRANALFHCIVLQGGEGKAFSRNIADRLEGHGAVCPELPGGRCLVLLPGGLDMDLFAHRLSHSTGSSVLFTTSAYDSDTAIEALTPYLPAIDG